MDSIADIGEFGIPVAAAKVRLDHFADY